ncbi:MAG: recJ [Rickettsiaceae bacterium]|jgi:single-stranded-DNA-specific exonuclease|nr:recJ [Rickettsiaceae bacterium]
MSYQSVLKKTYKKSAIDERLALTIQQRFGVASSVAKILSTRAASDNFDFEEIENFLNPTVKASLPDPFTLLDMDVAVKKIISAIKNKQKITIFGDYDVDGATSSALLKRFFAAVGVQAGIYIPDRILEGYGPNVEALLNLKKQGTDLVITVDCGTTSFEPLQAASEVGLEVIVIDHHVGAFEKPQAIAIINPNRLDEQFAHKNLAAVGVSFLLAVAVNKALREENFYQSNNISEPNLLSWLDLVALGTVCDVMTLDGVNRALVAQGLKVMKSRSNTGIRALCDVANLDEEPSSYHLGFVIGPRINAGGRVGRADLGARLLSTEDEDEAARIASELNIYNNQRKDIEQNILEEAKTHLEKTHQNNPVLLAASASWHQGVVGIVASKIKDLYQKPTAIIAIKDGIGKASCRSISGVDFGSAIIKAKLQGLLIAGGGHKMAAGFSVEESKIDELQNFLNEELSAAIELASQNKISELADILDINSANLGLAKEVMRLEPFGVGNAKPRFLIKDLQIVEAKLVGQSAKHIRCIFSAKTMAGWQGRLVGFAFNAMDSNLGEILLSKNGSKPVAIIGQVNINNWMASENLQLLVEDLVA